MNVASSASLWSRLLPSRKPVRNSPRAIVGTTHRFGPIQKVATSSFPRRKLL